MNHMSGFQALVTEVQGCDCGNGGPCAQTCASEYCLNAMFAQQNDACEMCISNSLGQNGQCTAQVSSQCQADPNCTAYLTCVNLCPP